MHVDASSTEFKWFYYIGLKAKSKNINHNLTITETQYALFTMHRH